MTIAVKDANGDTQTINTIADLMALVGEVQASPTSNTVLDRLKVLATSLTALQGYVDQLEGYSDGLETLIGTTNSTLTTVSGQLTTLAGYTDGIETLITATNSAMTALQGYTDGLEALTGAVTETAPANDTASSGLNGRLQRIAQRVTSLIALLPAALGQGTMAQSLTVAVASNQSDLSAKDMARVFSVAGTTLTRPANTTAYAAGDSISDNATAGSVTALPVTVSDTNDAPVTLTEIELDTTDTGLAAGAVIDVFVYNSDPTANTGVGGGDNAAFSNKRAGYRARFRGTFLAFSDGGKATCVPIDGAGNILPAVNMAVESGGKRLWTQYKAVTGFTPSANSTTIAPRFKGFQSRA